MGANDKQVGGEHYKSRIEPWDAINEWGLSYLDGSAVKYLARWRKKNGIQDIQKAIHFLEKLIEVENDRLRRTLDAANTNQQTITGSITQPAVGHGARTGNDVADREPPTSALRVGTETGYGQPQTLRDLL
jgi:hypothetical protein